MHNHSDASPSRERPAAAEPHPASPGSIPARFDRVVLGVDLGSPSLDAARWVARTLAPDAELIVVHALETGEGADAAARDEASRRLHDIAEGLGSRGAVRTIVRDDPPAVALASVAEETGADLIVVGPHGGRESTPGIGSTAERLIRTAASPVLLAAAPRARAPRQLLVPVDEIGLSLLVMEWADLLARRHGARVTLMHVLDPRKREPARDAPAIERWLTGLARELSEPEMASYVVVTGVPADEILAAAGRVSADLVVIGRRGRGRVLPGTIGSTASVVLRAAPCPVLIVGGPPDAELEEWADGDVTDGEDEGRP